MGLVQQGTLPRRTVCQQGLRSAWIAGVGSPPHYLPRTATPLTLCVGARIVSSVITLGRQLGLSVIAEGIESRRECRSPGEHGLRRGQGYWPGRPRLSEAFQGDFLGSGGVRRGLAQCGESRLRQRHKYNQGWILRIVSGTTSVD